MIKSSISIHDKFSVVIDVTYDKLLDKRRSKYTTVTYLFIPETLNINKKTYSTEKFYNDVRLFLKYDIPNYTLEDFTIGDHSLLHNLKKNTTKFINDPTEKNRYLFRDQVKMFATTFAGLVRNEINRLNKIRSKKSLLTGVDRLTTQTESILKEFRLLVELLKESKINAKKKKVSFYADEYMSNVVEYQFLKLFRHLKLRKFPDSELKKVVDLINSEQKYKKKQVYDSPKDKRVKPDNLMYKRSQLKKHIEKVFFLNQNIRKDGAILEQTLLALAAGLAMVFSTGVAFYYQKVYGNFTYPFFIALVLSYMMKDRIKGLISLLFVSNSRSFYYDYKINILNSHHKKIGVFKENFIFIPLKKLEQKVKEMRLIDRVVGVTSKSLQEQIIQYKKKIVIHPKRFGNDLPDENISGLTDITRFNFHRFIQYMDDPKEEFYVVKKGEVFKKVANKIYHINLIQRHHTEEGIEYYRYRVIISRDGIKRIEKVEFADQTQS